MISNLLRSSEEVCYVAHKDPDQVFLADVRALDSTLLRDQHIWQYANARYAVCRVLLQFDKHYSDL